MSGSAFLILIPLRRWWLYYWRLIRRLNAMNRSHLLPEPPSRSPCQKAGKRWGNLPVSRRNADRMRRDSSLSVVVWERSRRRSWWQWLIWNRYWLQVMIISIPVFWFLLAPSARSRLPDSSRQPLTPRWCCSMPCVRLPEIHSCFILLP